MYTWVQTIDSIPVERVEKQPTVIHTPQKRSATPSPAITPLEVENLPAKKKSTVTVPTTPKTASGKCRECGLLYMSREDNAFRKSRGKRATEWIGCDRPRCKYWAHASCAGLVLIPKKPIDEHTFFCIQHRQR